MHVALFLVQLAFASGALAGKLALNGEHVDPTALAFVRAAGGAMAFQLARLAFQSLRRHRPDAESAAPVARPTRRDHALLALYAVLGVCVNQFFFLHGLKRASATSTALLAATIPVFTALVATATRQEPITRRTAFGVCLATVGVLTLTGVRDLSIGNLLVTINSLSYAAYLVGVRPLLQRLGALVTIAWVFTYGAFILAPIGLWPLLRDAPVWTPAGAWLVAWFIAVPTIFAYLANAWALGRARASVVAGYIYLQPLLVLVCAGKLLGEALTLRVVAAGAAILAGVTVVATRRREAPAPSPSKSSE